MATIEKSTVVDVFETPIEEVVLEEKPKKQTNNRSRISVLGAYISAKVSPHWVAFRHYRSTDPFKKTVQSVFGFMIAILLSLIDATRTPLGPLNFMSAVSVILLFSDTAPSASSVGSVLQSSLRNSVAILVAAGSVSVFLQVSYLVGNREYISGAVILDIGLFVLTFIATYLRAAEPKEWTIPMINVKMYFILCIIRGSRISSIEGQMQLVVSLMNTFLSSFAVFLITSLLIFPKSASRDLRKQIQLSLLDIIKMVEVSTKAHFMNASSNDIDNLKELRTHTAHHFTKLDSLLKHSRMEIRYDNLTMEELEAIANSTKKLLQHVWSMVSCNDPVSAIQVSIPVYNAFIRPLRSEMQKLIEECIETLENLVTKLITHDLRCCAVKKPDLTDSSQIWRDLAKSLDEFDLKQHLMTHEFGDSDQVWEELFHIYGYIFAYREFVMELDTLVHCMNTLRRKNSFHAPTRFRLFGKNNKLTELYEAPQKVLTTREKLWKATLNLTSFNVLFSFKTSLTIAIFAIPAFLPAYKAFYQEWRGEWALVTLAVVVIPAFGGNYMNGIWRICGTIMGAAWGMITWLAFPGGPYGMFFMMSIFSVPFFYIMQNTKYVKFAVITTLTLVIVALGKYTSGVGVGDSIYEFFYKRSLCVVIGVIISLVENRLVWPYLARRELRKQLGTSLVNLSFLYSKIISMSTTKVTPSAIEEITYLESKLQLRILKHWEQLSFAKDEPRLKGAFPSASYESLIKSVQYMLDRLRVARMTVARGFGSVVLHDVIIPLSVQRKEMFVSIVLNLYILSGSLISQTSLPCYLPNAAKAREKFITSLRKLPVVQQGLFHNMKLDFIYYYAYTLAMKDLIHELEKMGVTLKELFGEISFTRGAFFEDLNKSISKDV